MSCMNIKQVVVTLLELFTAASSQTVFTITRTLIKQIHLSTQQLFHILDKHALAPDQTTMFSQIRLQEVNLRWIMVITRLLSKAKVYSKSINEFRVTHLPLALLTGWPITANFTTNLVQLWLTLDALVCLLAPKAKSGGIAAVTIISYTFSCFALSST